MTFSSNDVGVPSAAGVDAAPRAGPRATGVDGQKTESSNLNRVGASRHPVKRDISQKRGSVLCSQGSSRSARRSRSGGHPSILLALIISP